MIQPRYAIISSRGSLSPSTASTLFALLAKTIELSFVTVFVTFLGQVLSRRSFVKASRGVTIPELTMRTWVIQPGFMITHWQHIQHAGLTVLSAITLTAAVVAVFYTTASDALVSPHLKYGKWKSQEMWGLVEASYANQNYIMQNCQTPITTAIDDPADAGDTCLAMEHAGQGTTLHFQSRKQSRTKSFQHTIIASSILIHGRRLAKEGKVSHQKSRNGLHLLQCSLTTRQSLEAGFRQIRAT